MQFYESDAFLVESVSQLVASALDAGEASVIIATSAHREGVEAKLLSRGIDVAAARASGRFVALDAAETLLQLMVGGVPDPRRFEEVIGGVVARASVSGLRARVRAFGEMVALLWADGNGVAAIRLEELWNDLAKRRSFVLLCGYPIRGFRQDADRGAFGEISTLHSEVIPTESYVVLDDSDEQLRAIAELQQKAEALETEIAERKKLERELELRVAQLAETDRRKDEFLAMLGHELRNPLAAVKNALQLMRVRGDDANRMIRAREIIERNVERTTRLIDDLLDVSRITRGRIQLREEIVVLASVLERAVETVRPLIDERGHRLTLELPGEPVTFRADPARLEQIVSNLLHNAAKYTEVGGRIQLRAVHAGSWLTISVIDDGAGMHPELCDRVFDLFYQGDETRLQARGGLGIGLTLVRRLVELQGGHVEARSEGPGLGSEFVVRLPLQPMTPAVVHDAAATLEPNVPRRRILVVDDNVDAAESLAELLRDDGHQVRTAHNGAAALDEAARLRPELVLLDIRMPELDGFEVARRLRGDLGLSSARLIALSGYGDERYRQQTREAGFDGHLTKPIDIRQLEHLLSDEP